MILFPDAGCYNNKWSNKIRGLPQNILYNISELVEEKSTAQEKDECCIADYIWIIYLNKKKDL